MKPPEAPSALELVSSRAFAASRERLFEAFRDPDQLVHWWGPEGFTNTFQEFELRPGGAWRFVMHGTDGVDYAIARQFVEIVSPERIVFDHLRPMHRFRMTMTFEEAAGSTVLTWRMHFESTEELAGIEAMLQIANQQNFDRLEAHLTTRSSSGPGRAAGGA